MKKYIRIAIVSAITSIAVAAIVFPLVTGAQVLTGTAPSFVSDLHYGISSSLEVTALQEFLAEHGWYNGPITGNFFSLTLKGVRTFQKAQSITPLSGYFGPKSRAAANSILDAEVPGNEDTASSATTTTPEATTTPIIVIVQVPTSTPNPLPVPPPAPAPAPTVIDPASFPVISASASKLDDGTYKIEWLATQRDRDALDCTSPQIGKIGSQGVLIRTLEAGATFEFSCTDRVTNSNSSQTLTVQ